MNNIVFNIHKIIYIQLILIFIYLYFAFTSFIMNINIYAKAEFLMNIKILGHLWLKFLAGLMN